MKESARRAKSVLTYLSAINGPVGGPGVSVARLVVLFQVRLVVGPDLEVAIH